MTPMDNKIQLFLGSRDGERDASEAKEPDDGLGIVSLSLDHPPLCLSLQYKVRQCPTGGYRKASTGGPGPWVSVRDWSSLGCVAGLTLCFASPGGRTSYASRMAGCATWHRRLSASCLLTQRKTSSLSPSTQTSLHSGR